MAERYKLLLTDEEKSELEAFVKQAKGSAKRVKRAQILLAVAKNGLDKADKEVSLLFGSSVKSIERLRKRCCEEGLQIALEGKKREVFKEKRLTGEVEAKLCMLACSDAPEGFSHWTLQLLADKMVELNYIDRISHTSVGTLLKKNELKPWKQKMWVIPKASAEFVCQMEQVLAVYQRPYDEQYPVICLDESPKQLISEIRTPVKDSHGVTRFDSEYTREGVVQLYMLFEPLAGKRVVEVRDSNNRFEWAKIVADLVENHYATATKITLVQDNLKAHKPSAMYEVFEPERAKAILDKIEFVFTPKHGSWLNMAEIEFSVLKRQGISQRIPDKQTLIEQLNHWQNQRNQKQVKANWQFQAKDARIRLKKLYPTI